jgi:hypothetical protein
MAVKASSSITLSSVVDVKAVYRYYLLQSSTLSPPSKPTTNPPSTSWDDTEPNYVDGSTNSLYFVDLTVFSDDTWVYSEVSLSTSYEAAKSAYNKAVNAQNTANNAQSTANKAQTSVDNLQIGGRNLIIGTSNEWTNASMSTWRMDFSMIPIADLVSKYGLKNGDPLVLCIYAKSLNGKDFYFRVQHYNDDATYVDSASVWDYAAPNTGGNEGWMRLYFTLDTSYTYLKYFIGSQNSSQVTGTTIEQYKCLKLERGTKYTDWSPAPEDNVPTSGGNNILVGTSSDYKNLTVGTYSGHLYNVRQDTCTRNAIKTGDMLTYSIYLKPMSNKTLRAMIVIKDNATETEVSRFTGTAIQPGTEGVSTVTFAAPDPSMYYIMIYVHNVSSATVTGDTTEQYKRLKLEVGTVATAWTPAVYDITSSVSNAQTTANNAQTTANNAQTTANNAQASVDNMQIGGRNFILGTSNEFTDFTMGTYYAEITSIPMSDLVSRGLRNGDKIVLSVYTKALSAKTHFANLVHYTPPSTRRDDTVYQREAPDTYASEGWFRIYATLDTSYEILSIRIGNTNQSGATGNTTEQYKCLKLEKGTKYTDWSPAPEDITNDIIDSADEIRTEIVDSSARVYSDSEKAMMEALAEYVKSTDHAQWKEYVESQLNVLPGEISGRVSELRELINTVDSEAKEKLTQIEKFFTFDINGLTIGQVDSPYKIVIDNDRYSMFVNNVEVLWIDIETREVHTPELTVTDRLRLSGYHAEVASNGNFNWNYIGG